MLLRSSETDTDNNSNFLVKLSLGKYGVTRTYFHLVFALIFCIAVTFFSKFAQWNALGIAIAVFSYGVYITNVGLGLWRASRTIKQEILSFFTKVIAALSAVAGVMAIFNAINLLFTYL
ncbi:hypothetical protein Z042_23040 [Chania multitudinisentens RB-25]|uniref:Uncharacterized protein n=1 Tax=Chania multitudinisentens RB-25 TaxID=1441930 RepID=W0LLR8_9GAMM|nr:hypothetical protein [Chania multitudinisentens]AHG22990.1 hypothetical protein Z042_23040 [Chania multitudinisentens RB-25]